MSSMRHTSMSPLREDPEQDVSNLYLHSMDLADCEEDCMPFSTVPDEGIVMRKISEVSNASSTGSGGGAEVAQSDSKESRKVSDISNHSGESGIESTTSKVSDASKDGDGDACKQTVSAPERKLSDSSNGSSTEDELALIRNARAGSVSRTIEKFDSLNSMSRSRKSGLPTVQVVHNQHGEAEGSNCWNDKVIPTGSTHSV